MAGGYALRGQVLAQVGETLISGESAWLMGDYQSERYDRDLRRLNSLSVDHSFKIRSPISADTRRNPSIVSRIDGGSRLEVGSRLSFNIKQINASAELEWVKDRSPNGTNPPARLDASLRLSGRVGGLRLRGEAQFGLTGDSGFP